MKQNLDDHNLNLQAETQLKLQEDETQLQQAFSSDGRQLQQTFN